MKQIRSVTIFLILFSFVFAKTNENKIKKIVTDLICFIIHLYMVYCIRLKKEVKVKINIFFVVAIA